MYQSLQYVFESVVSSVLETVGTISEVHVLHLHVGSSATERQIMFR